MFISRELDDTLNSFNSLRLNRVLHVLTPSNLVARLNMAGTVL
jgi:hypothetical protein